MPKSNADEGWNTVQYSLDMQLAQTRSNLKMSSGTHYYPGIRITIDECSKLSLIMRLTF